MILTYELGDPGSLEYQFSNNIVVIDPVGFGPGLSAHSGEYALLDDYPNANGGNVTITRVDGGMFSFLDTYLEGWKS